MQGAPTVRRTLGCADRVKLLGFRKDTLNLYHAMDAFVLSSIREGLPNVVLEAMAFGVPVLSTRVAGVPNVITDGDNLEKILEIREKLPHLEHIFITRGPKEKDVVDFREARLTALRGTLCSLEV